MLNPHGLYVDTHCAAQAQGESRYERGLWYRDYERYLAHKWDAPLNHTYCLVPAVGHNKDQIFLSQCVKDILFGK